MKPGKVTEYRQKRGALPRYLRVVKDAPAIVGADDRVLPVLAEISCSDEARLAIHLIPQSDLLVRNIPEPQLPIKGAT